MKKLLCVAFAAFALAGCQTTAESNRAPEYLPDEQCPVKIGNSEHYSFNSNDCYRNLVQDNLSYYHVASWEGVPAFSQVYFQEIGGFGIWKNDPNPNKKDIFRWNAFKDVDLADIKELSCDGFSCFSVPLADSKMPDGKAECVWFRRNSAKGRRGSNAGVNNFFDGYFCDAIKVKAFTDEEAARIVGYYDLNE
ncbi:membrane lipoprotein lipid attachment site-containing protein [Kiloniella sp. b19]|uniref:membrane lipoprotein lipid attachment site-containing protein n=1 Tax=Kiloniella sp. GXU_MW_B19 TaxID=3141326 RepID=UPI0031E0DD5B